MGDFSREPRRIRRELKMLKVKKGGDWLEDIKANIQAQVNKRWKKLLFLEEATAKFAEME